MLAADVLKWLLDACPAPRQWPAVSLFQRGTWWWLASAIAIGILLGLGSIEVISLMARALGVVFLGATLAAALFPIVSWLHRFVPRVVAVILVYVAIIAVLGVLGWLVLPRLWIEARQAAVEVPNLIESSRGWLEEILGQEVSGMGGSLTDLAGRTATALAGVPNAVLSVGAAAFVALFVSFYWLILHENIKESFLSLFPQPRRQQVHDVLAKGASSMGGYLRGAVIDSAAVGVATYIGLWLIGVDYALVLGVLTGVLGIIPVVGATVSFLVVSALAFLQNTRTGLFATGYMFAVQQLENHLLAPNVMSSQTNASPLLILIAIFTGGIVGGFIGVLIAIPLAAFLQVLFVEMIAPAFRQQTGAPPVAEDRNESEP